MNKKIFYGLSAVLFIPACVFADSFVPEFDKMKNLRCDFVESIYNQDGAFITKSSQHRIYRLDDEYKKIYLQKEPIDNILYYADDKIEFNLQSMSDEFIMMSHTVIDKNSLSYSSTAEIIYDNPVFGIHHSKSEGTCKFFN